MIMITNCSGMWERFALRSDACDDGRSAQLLCLHVTSPQLINIIDIVDFFSKNHHYDHYPHIDYYGCVAWLLCLLTCKLSSSKLPSYCYHKNDQTRIITMVTILIIIITRWRANCGARPADRNPEPSPGESSLTLKLTSDNRPLIIN